MLHLGGACTVGLVSLALPALAQQSAEAAVSLPQELRSELPDAQLQGSATLRFLGMDIYKARLWTSREFKAASYTQSAFGLELIYMRSLSGRLIAERSLKEMQRQGRASEEREQAWLAAMAQAFPDVKAGDRITGVYRPGAGTNFWFNGQTRPAVHDASFGPVFFGIWLSDATSEPKMRTSLLGQQTP